MSKTFMQQGGFVLVLLALAGCVSDPRLNTGLSVGMDGISMKPSVQANVGGGLLQYTPQLQ